MDSELQWFSDQRFVLCLREELLVTCMFRCFYLYGFLILRLGLRLREVIVLMHFYIEIELGFRNVRTVER